MSKRELSADVDMHALAEELAGMLGKPTPPLMTAEQAAEFLNVPVSWIRAEARAERIPAVRLGRYTRFRAADLEPWLDVRTVGPRANGKRSS
jgi:excisionase family DNA binding protein